MGSFHWVAKARLMTVCALLMTAGVLPAQTLGEITGEVKDASGAVVAQWSAFTGGIYHQWTKSTKIVVEFTREVNRVRVERSGDTVGRRKELEKIQRDLDRAIQAILDGVPGAQLKDKIGGLEARKAQLTELLANAEEPPPLPIFFTGIGLSPTLIRLDSFSQPSQSAFGIIQSRRKEGVAD